MRIDVLDSMESELTVLNRRTVDGADEWTSSKVPGFWSREGGTSMSNWYVQPGDVVKVQIAEEDAEDYVEPSEWNGDGWTLRPGDVIVREGVDFSGGTSEMLEATDGMEKATVNKVEDLRLGESASGLSGLSKWASILYCEGE